MENKEQITRMIDERLRDLAHQGEIDAALTVRISDMALKITELDAAVKYSVAGFIDFRKDMSNGFIGINQRLDKQNGYRAEHERRIEGLGNRLTAVESTWSILKLFVPILGAIGAALIIAQITGGP